MIPARFPTIGPREERQYIAAARKRRATHGAAFKRAIRLKAANAGRGMKGPKAP